MRYAVVASGVIENVIEAEAGFELPGKVLALLDEGSPLGIGWRFVNSEWVPPEPEAPLRRLPPQDFLRLFTSAEVVAIKKAGDGDTGDENLIVALLDMTTIITFIDLDHLSTQQYLGYLHMTGFISAERLAQIQNLEFQRAAYA